MKSAVERGLLRIAWYDTDKENTKRVAVEELQGEEWVDVSQDFLIKTKSGKELYVFSIAHLEEVEAKPTLTFLHFHILQGDKSAFVPISMIKKHNYLVRAMEGIKNDGLKYFAIEPLIHKSDETGAYIYTIVRLGPEIAKRLDAIPHLTVQRTDELNDPDELGLDDF